MAGRPREFTDAMIAEIVRLGNQAMGHRLDLFEYLAQQYKVTALSVRNIYYHYRGIAPFSELKGEVKKIGLIERLKALFTRLYWRV